jgi:hypothetical protein
MSKPIPPPPPARRRVFTPEAPIKPTITTRTGFTVDRTSRPGVIRTRKTTDAEIRRMQRQDRFGR